MINTTPIQDVEEAELETLEALSARFADMVEQAERNYGEDR